MGQTAAASIATMMPRRAKKIARAVNRLTRHRGCRRHSPANELQRYSMEELVFERRAAAEYDRAFAHVTRYFMPFVLRAARVARGMRVVFAAGMR